MNEADLVRHRLDSDFYVGTDHDARVLSAEVFALRKRIMGFELVCRELLGWQIPLSEPVMPKDVARGLAELKQELADLRARLRGQIESISCRTAVVKDEASESATAARAPEPSAAVGAPWNLSTAYEAEIRPVLAKLMELCEKYDVPGLALVQIKQAPVSSTEPIELPMMVYESTRPRSVVIGSMTPLAPSADPSAPRSS